MSRYTLAEKDLVATIGMDFAVQFWITDHRGEHLPLKNPAKLTVKDSTGSIVVETVDVSLTDPTEIDPMTEASVGVSDSNGMMQAVIPRSITATIPPGRYYYDAWATIWDDEAVSNFPEGQQLPLVKGTFMFVTRVTQL